MLYMYGPEVVKFILHTSLYVMCLYELLVYILGTMGNIDDNIICPHYNEFKSYGFSVPYLKLSCD